MNDEGAARIRALAQAVRDLVGPGELSGLSVLDLGAGGGEIAAELALRGASVTAVEGRARNAADIRSLRDAHGLAGRLEVVEADVRELDWDALGPFDVVVVSGLLYHLRLPEAAVLLAAVRQACRRLLLVDTEVAWGPLERAEAGGRRYAGLHFREHDRGTTTGERRASRLASLDNEESFWLTRPSLHAMLHDAGFASSWELGAPGQPRREQRATVAAVVGEPVARLELDPARKLPDPRPVEPAGGRLLRARLALARLSRR